MHASREDTIYNEHAVGIHSRSKQSDSTKWVEIPAELLRDPIRNGSMYLEHGFNPWNEEQKARIIAHLEGELVRLTDIFLRDGSESTSEVAAGGP